MQAEGMGIHSLVHEEVETSYTADQAAEHCLVMVAHLEEVDGAGLGVVHP